MVLKIKYHIHYNSNTDNEGYNEELECNEVTGDDGSLAFPSNDLSWWVVDPCRPYGQPSPNVCPRCWQIVEEDCRCQSVSSAEDA